MEKQIEDLISNREKFDKFIYTPLDEAILELKRREKLETITKGLDIFLGNDIPEMFLRIPRATILRNITTPNYELRRFLSIVDVIDGMEPLIVEYPQDKFFPSNILKRLLGKLGFFKGMANDKRHSSLIDRMPIIDFDISNGKEISEINTLWGQSLVEFHHEFFNKTYRSMSEDIFYDISSWYHRHGPEAFNYYSAVLSLFIRHGILFENFMLDDKDECNFVKHVVLPAFLNIYKSIGLKPLIVALEPTQIEGDKFWLCYPIKDKGFVEKKFAGISK